MMTCKICIPAIALATVTTGCSTVPLQQEVPNEQSCGTREIHVGHVEDADVDTVVDAFRSLQCLDGGELEDAYRELGVAFAHQPAVVIDGMYRSGIPIHMAMPMLTMLPSDFVDNPCASVTELQRRESAVATSQIESRAKIEFVSAIRQAIERERSHCQE